jgi:hypothetical protein
VLFSAACRGAAEQPVVEKFFTASRLHDKTALADVATVAIDPVTQGSVTDFTILHVDRESSNETVTVEATVHLPDGSFGKRKLVLTLKRDPTGKLTVTGVTTLPL